ncbi:MAG: CBS domain-containing protein [Acidobacteriota bacterium]
MATFVRQMLSAGSDVVSVTPDTSVYDALRVMAEHNVGAVLVMSGTELKGLISERDYARKVALQGLSSKDTPVRDIMSAKIICVDPGWTAEQCMALMNERHIRHLPVLDGGTLVGVISIRDVVKAVVDEQQFTINALTHYITG